MAFKKKVNDVQYTGAIQVQLVDMRYEYLVLILCNYPVMTCGMFVAGYLQEGKLLGKSPVSSNKFETK